MLHLDIKNISAHKRLYLRRHLVALAERICRNEGIKGEAEVSLVLCDDAFIRKLNLQYRGKDEPTDVLSFQQEAITPEGPRALGDIVISLDMVQRFCGGDRASMKKELQLLFCHGLLHLLGFTHDKTADRRIMLEKQAQYLGIEVEQAWHT